MGSQNKGTRIDEIIKEYVASSAGMARTVGSTFFGMDEVKTKGLNKKNNGYIRLKNSNNDSNINILPNNYDFTSGVSAVLH